MIRRAISGLALTAVLATPAVAENPFTVDFTFHNYGSSTQYDQYAGQFGSGDIFQVFCVDPTLHVTNGQTYSDAWVTPMSSLDFSHVQNPGGLWSAQYEEAARIATGLFADPTAGSALSDTDMQQYQYAIWNAMGFAVDAGGSQYWPGYDAAQVALIRTAAASIVIFPNQWLVITDANKDYQEFITFDADRPQETVPEPATMTLLATGLAGLAATKRRRNKKS